MAYCDMKKCTLPKKLSDSTLETICDSILEFEPTFRLAKEDRPAFKNTIQLTYECIYKHSDLLDCDWVDENMSQYVKEEPKTTPTVFGNFMKAIMGKGFEAIK